MAAHGPGPLDFRNQWATGPNVLILHESAVFCRKSAWSCELYLENARSLRIMKGIPAFVQFRAEGWAEGSAPLVGAGACGFAHEG